jgi:hypothetical protein
VIALRVYMNAEEMGKDFPAGRNLIEANKSISVGLLQKGMASGLSSVSFLFELPDGSIVFAETSLRLFLSCAQAFAALEGWPGETAKTIAELVVAAVKAKKYLGGADLRGADLGGAYDKKLKVQSLAVFSGLYRYDVWAVVLSDGTHWVRMGCLFYSLKEWAKIGIRNSNLDEFPDDGSEKCEERVAAFRFAKAHLARKAKNL